MDKLFIQYNKICAENIVALPELANAVADKNVLAVHVRESLKEVDELLKSLKNQCTEKVKAMEQNAATTQMDSESVSIMLLKIPQNLTYLFLIILNCEFMFF